MQASQRLVRTARQWLLNQLNTGCDQIGHQIGQQPGRPGLIGIDHDAGFGQLLAHDVQEVQMALRVNLQLDQRQASGRARPAPHLFVASQAEGERRDHGPRLLQAGQGPNGQTALLGAQIPQRAVDCVAGAAGRQQIQQVHAAQVVTQQRRDRIDLRRHRCRRLAVVIDTCRFGPTRVAASVGQADRDQGQLMHHLARDLERLAQLPALQQDLDAQSHTSRALAIASTPPRIGSHTGRPSSSATAWR